MRGGLGDAARGLASERRKVRDTRLVLAVLLALSMCVNALLAHGLSRKESMAVLVPAVAGPAWTVGEIWAGRRYLRTPQERWP